MKTYLIHRDGVVCPDYGVFTGETKQDATLEFIGDYCETPELMGVELVEYVAADTLEKIQELLKRMECFAEYVQDDSGICPLCGSGPGHMQDCFYFEITAALALLDVQP